jgi:hypothetical protein
VAERLAVEVATLTNAGEVQILGRLFLNEENDVAYVLADQDDDDTKRMFEELLDEEIFDEDMLKVDAQLLPEEWLGALPRHLKGSYLRARKLP